MKIYNLLLYELYAFIFMVPLLPYRIKIKVLPLSADTALGMLFIFTFLLYVLTERKYRKAAETLKKSFLNDKLVLSITAYTIILFISLSVCVKKSVGLGEIARFLEYPFFFYFIIWEIKDIKVLRTMLNAFTCSIIISMICGLVQIPLIMLPGGQNIVCRIFYSENQIYGPRAYSTFVNPNYWGAFINLIIFTYFFLYTRVEKRKAYMAVMVLGVANLLLTFTVGSWISFIIVAGVLLLAKKREYIKTAAGIGILLIVLLLAVTPLRNGILYLFHTKINTGSERIKLWTTGMLMFRDHPILGVGSGNYLVRYGEYVKKYPDLYMWRSAYTVHNSYIKVMAETGIMGIIAFLILVSELIKKVVSLYRVSSDIKLKYISLGVLAGCTTFILQNFTNNMFFIPQVNIFFWMQIASLIALSQIKAINK